MLSRPRRVVWIEDSLDWVRSLHRTRDGRRNAFARHVSQFLVHQLGWVGATLADQLRVEPFPRNALELPEEVELRLIALITPLGNQQPLGQMIEEGRLPKVLGVDQV